jgi:hypothetical protein
LALKVEWTAMEGIIITITTGAQVVAAVTTTMEAAITVNITVIHIRVIEIINTKSPRLIIYKKHKHLRAWDG